MSTNKTEIVIIGAGLSGLTVAQQLPADTDFIILEKQNVPGGFSTQFASGDYWFDYGGHYFHFQDKAHVKDLLNRFTKFKGFKRISKTFLLNSYIPFPVQFHLSFLPAGLRHDIYREMQLCLANPQGEFPHLQDYLLAKFGKTLTALFFEPFLSKYYNSPTSSLAANMDKGSIPVPDIQRVEQGYRGETFNSAGYNATIFYPAPHLRQFVANYAAPVNHRIHYHEEVTEIDIQQKRVTTTGGSYHYDRLVTTMPLNQLVTAITPRSGFPSPENFKHTSTLLVNAVLKKKRKRFHWVYLAEKQFPFYRAGLYAGTAQPVCYLEKNLPPSYSMDVNRSDIVNEVAFTLKALQVIQDPGEILYTDIRLLPVSYVIFHRQWHCLVPPLLEKLKSLGIYSIGRYGTWNYSSMANDIKDALALKIK